MSLFLYVRGVPWVVDRRHEMAQLMHARAQRERRLFLFFTGPDGELRRSEIAEDFPDEPAAPLLVSVWRNAEVLREGAPGEMESRGELTMPRLRDVARYFARAMVARCPLCGSRPVLRSWFTLRRRCPGCHIRLDRGESEDYFLGGIFFNIVLAELVFAAVLTVWLVAVWPDVPWDRIEYVLAAAMVLAPIVLYPMSRLLWLALDLLLRPPDDREMAWHDAAGGAE
ncbi:MAG TPA: hypothetical protein VGT98_05890 [Candidatus Elarobacter sp.]|nr:hypothetical protein [Candidatus Elarobacter sp.]